MTIQFHQHKHHKVDRAMECWDWEFFDTVVTASTFAVTDSGPLFGPVTDFKLERDEALNLVFETTSTGDSVSNAVERPAGSVYTADAVVTLEGLTDAIAIAGGVIPREHRKMWGTNSEQCITKERSTVHSLQWTRNNSRESAYVIDWVGNMESFIWPDADDRIKSGENKRILRSKTREITMSVPIDLGGGGRTCVHLVVDGVEFFVGESKAKPKHIAKPGFILYIGTPDGDTRAKIRDCLSFCFGSFLLFLGDTKFDSEWLPTSFVARSGHTLVKEAPNLIGWKPSPLGHKWENEISSDVLERMMSSLTNIYETYGLQSSFWSYWHALAAPIHMKAVHFGAAIEALQNVFIKTTPGIKNRIVEDEQQWTELCGQISSYISGSDIPKEAKQLLINKAKNLNLAPQGVVMQRFFSALGLTIGELEKAVWANRNRAAHGGNANTNNAHRLIRENKVLHIMMNRILIALGDGADWYYDYYTLGRPMRRLAEPIPDDKTK